MVKTQLRIVGLLDSIHEIPAPMKANPPLAIVKPSITVFWVSPWLNQKPPAISWPSIIVVATFTGSAGLDPVTVMALVVGPMAQDALPFLPIGAPSGLLLVIVGAIAILFGVLEPRGMAHRWSLVKAFYRLWPFGY